MEPHIYKYRFGRSAYYGAVVYLALFGLLGWLLFHLYEGGYLSAWFTSFIVAIIALMALSIPRKIVVTEDRVEIRCLLDITEVRRDEIASVRRVEPGRMKWFIPIFGGYGFSAITAISSTCGASTACGSTLRSGRISSRSPTSTKSGSMSPARMPTGLWPS